MAKKSGFNPFILMMIPTPEPTTVIGGGTGQSTTDPYACDFNEWMSLFASDIDGDNDTDFDDYRLWFQQLFGGDPDEGQELWELVGNDGSLFP